MAIESLNNIPKLIVALNGLRHSKGNFCIRLSSDALILTGAQEKENSSWIDGNNRLSATSGSDFILIDPRFGFLNISFRGVITGKRQLVASTNLGNRSEDLQPNYKSAHMASSLQEMLELYAVSDNSLLSGGVTIDPENGLTVHIRETRYQEFGSMLAEVKQNPKMSLVLACIDKSLELAENIKSGEYFAGQRNIATAVSEHLRINSI